MCNFTSSPLRNPAPSNRTPAKTICTFRTTFIKRNESWKPQPAPTSRRTWQHASPEKNIKPGDYVTALTEIYELPSFLWCCTSSTLAADEPVRSVYKARNAGQPSKVIAVCLPFVYTKQARGGTRDLRPPQTPACPARPRHWSQGVEAIAEEFEEETEIASAHDRLPIRSTRLEVRSKKGEV